MAKRPPSLPSPLTRITVPAVFHPSSFSQLERCPLSALGLIGGNVEGLLVPHPEALFGVILHHVRHEVLAGRWGEAGGPRRAALEIFTSAVEDVESMLQRDNATAGLVPLRVSVGRRRLGEVKRRTWNAGLIISTQPGETSCHMQSQLRVDGRQPLPDS